MEDSSIAMRAQWDAKTTMSQEPQSTHSPVVISNSLWEETDALVSGLLTQLTTGIQATTTQLKTGTDNHTTLMEWALISTGLMVVTMAIGNLTTLTKPALGQSKTCMTVATCTRMENGTVAKITMMIADMLNMNSQQAQFPSKLMTLAIDETPLTV